MELRYHLNGYGISTDTIPLSWTGTLKVSFYLFTELPCLLNAIFSDLDLFACGCLKMIFRWQYDVAIIMYYDPLRLDI